MSTATPTKLFVRRPEVVEVDVITFDMLEELRAGAAGFVKNASVGDYLVRSAEPEVVSILTPQQLERRYQHEEAARFDETARQAEQFGKLNQAALDIVRQLEGKVLDLEQRQDKGTVDQGVAIRNVEKRVLELLERITLIEQRAGNYLAPRADTLPAPSQGDMHTTQNAQPNAPKAKR